MYNLPRYLVAMADEDQPTVEQIEYADDLVDPDQDDGQAASINANPANAVGQGPNGQNPNPSQQPLQAQQPSLPQYHGAWNDFDWAFLDMAAQQTHINAMSTAPPSTPQQDAPIVLSPNDMLQSYLIRQQLCAGIHPDDLEPMNGWGSCQWLMVPQGVPYIRMPAIVYVSDQGVVLPYIRPAEVTGTLPALPDSPWFRFPRRTSRTPANNGTTGANGGSIGLPNAPAMNSVIPLSAFDVPTIAPTEQDIENAINGTNGPQSQQWSLTPGANDLQSSVAPNNQITNVIDGINGIQLQQSSQFPPAANGLQYDQAMNTIDDNNGTQPSQFPPTANGMQYDQAMNTINGTNGIQPQQLQQFPPGANGLQHDQAMNTIDGLNLIQPQQLQQFPPGANGLQYNQSMDSLHGTYDWPQFTPGVNSLQSSVLPDNQTVNAINSTNGFQPQQWSQFTPEANGLQSSVLPGNQTMDDIDIDGILNDLRTQNWPQLAPGANVTNGPQPNTNQHTFGNSIADAAQGINSANNGDNLTIDPVLLANPFPSLASSSLLPNGTQHVGSTDNVNGNVSQLNPSGYPHAHQPWDNQPQVNYSGQLHAHPSSQAIHPGMYPHAHPPTGNQNVPRRLGDPMNFGPPLHFERAMNVPTEAPVIGFIPYANDATNALPAADVNMADADNGAQQFMPTNNQTADDFSGITYPNPPVTPANDELGAIQYPDPTSYGWQAMVDPFQGLSPFIGTDHGSQQQIPNPLGSQYPFTTTAGPQEMMPGVLTEVQPRDTTDSGSQQASSSDTGSLASFNQEPRLEGWASVYARWQAAEASSSEDEEDEEDEDEEEEEDEEDEEDEGSPASDELGSNEASSEPSPEEEGEDETGDEL